MLTSIIAAVIPAVIILGTLVLIHEAGHFAMAKRCGVRVLRFSIGYPPKIFGIRRGETEYAIGATPFGGYVRMLGDEIGDELGAPDIELYLSEIAQDLVQAAQRAAPEEPALGAVQEKKLALGDSARPETGSDNDRLHELVQIVDHSPDREGLVRRILGRPLRDEEVDLLDEVRRRGSSAQAIKYLAEHHSPAMTRRIEKQAFPCQSLGKRSLIVLAGPLANILLAPVLLTFIYLYGVPVLLPVLGQIQKNMPAAMAGLGTGDKVLSVDGHRVRSWDDLSALIKQSNGRSLRIEVQRSSQRGSSIETITIAPRKEVEQTPFGDNAPQWVIGVLPSGDTVLERENPFAAVPHALVETARMSEMLVVGIAKILSGATPVRQALGGPIMIARMAGKEARQGIASILMFTVMLTIELGIINLLPVPMLDGGHLFFFLIEGVRGKPLKVRHREIAQQVGLFLLVMLMAFVIFNDISRIVQG